MFVEPVSITVNAVAQSMARTESGVNRGAFRKDDGSHALSIAHTLGKQNQRLIRFDRRTTVADPFTTGSNYEVQDSVWLVTRTPNVGLTIVQQKQLIDGFITYLAASSGAAITKLLGGES
jgi:hypothetical protein